MPRIRSGRLDPTRHLWWVTCALALASRSAGAQESPPAPDGADSAEGPATPPPESTLDDPDAEASALERELSEAAAAPEAPPLTSPAAEAPAPNESAQAAPSGRALPAAAPEDEVVVTAGRVHRAPGSLHVLGPEVLERFQYDDPHATLQLVPGVYVRQEDGFGLRPNIGIRGAISDRSKKVALMQDGVLFGPAPYSAPAAYYFPIISRMTEMKVIKGPSAVRYGPQTIGGAIDLLTRAIPQSSRGSVDLAGGQYGYGKLHAHYGSRSAHAGFLVEGVHLRSSGFKELPDDENTGFVRNEWMFKGARDLSPEQSRVHDLTVHLEYSDEASNETYLGLTDADFRVNPNRRYAASRLDHMSWHRTSGSLTHRIEPAGWVRFTTTAYRHDLSRTWNKVNHFAGASLFNVMIDPDAPNGQAFYQVLSGQRDSASEAERLFIGPNHRSYVSQGVQTRAEVDATTGPLSHALEWGARLHWDSVRRRHTEEPYQLVGNRPELVASPTVVTTDNRAETLALATHVTDELRWGALTLTPGVRLELISSEFVDYLAAQAGQVARSERFVSVFLPGIGAHYALTPAFGLLAGVHRGMSPPAPGADESVEPESSINYEVGARYTDGFRRLELIGYFNDYRNLTNVCTLSGGCEASSLDLQFDAGRARIYGFEAFVEESLFAWSLRFPISLSYTLTMTELLETFQSEDPIFGDVEAGDEMPYVPRHQGRASLGVEHDLLGGYAAVSYVGRMRERSGSGPIDLALATEEQITVDLGAHYQALDWLRLYANLRNAVGDQFIVSRRPYGARPNAPRWLQVGARLDFD